MKKTLVKGMALAFVGSLLVAGSAMALPTLSGDYAWTNADYFTLTDYTTSSSNITLVFENASYESDFGLYTIDNSGSAIASKFQVFNYFDEPTPLGTEKAVYFNFFSGAWHIDDDNIWDGTEQAFNNTFGFYFGVHTGGITDPTADYQWYGDKRFNADGLEHLAIAYSPLLTKALICLDDQSGGGDRDFDDMIVGADDVAPVPEPATMLLMGTGLAGLAGAARKRRSKKA